MRRGRARLRGLDGGLRAGRRRRLARDLTLRPDGRARGARRGLAIYADRRLLAIFGMGFASGLPLLLTTSTLSYRLARAGVDKTAIGLFALVGLPYSLKFLWAPALDHVRLPGLGRLGQRRGWILLSQAVAVAAILALGTADPAAAPLATAALALAVAFASATQDVAVDAYRIEVLRDDEQGAGAAATQAGYRAGMLVAGAGAIAASDFVAWRGVFAGLAALLALAMLVTLLAPEPAPPPAPRARATLRVAFLEPLRDFATRPHWLAILAFALLYKFGDAIAGVMANPFFVELGFSGVEIASLNNVLGLAASVTGIVAGGLLVARAGILRALLWGGILQAATNLLFAWLAGRGRDLAALALAIGADGFTGGLASAAFVAFLSSLCRGAFTATQYALLTSFMAAGRTALSSGGGWLADRMDWAAFFALTAALAVPGLALLARIGRPARP